MSSTGAVVGASDHYARAELVTLAWKDGAPVFVDRRRVALIGEGLPTAPFHHEALEMELEAAKELVERVQRSVTEHAGAALRTMQAEFGATGLVLRASPFARLPDSLEKILSSRTVTLAADGMLYREALADAARALGMEVERTPRKADSTLLASDAMGVDVSEVRALVARFGKEAGAPWRKDHKLAAAAALSVLARRDLR